MRPRQRLVDLGCGTGGAGLWLARALGAELDGIDIPPVAVSLADRRAHQFLPAGRATFHVGTLGETGLDSASADGVICADAFSFAPDGRAALEELRRIPRPGARALITSPDRHPASSKPWDRVGLELEAEGERPHVPGMWRRLYRLWADHEDELRNVLGEAQAERMIGEARRRAPEMDYRRFSVATVRRPA
ncbi:class I SAM-dependent methyltransferase [Streptomyces albireticuli]|nr:class I SAM-dependent methyltransferase [Streptomyces albireticuli]MCD9195451.1 class I SAM-dependent methyltransferase [Streptomyces albireticuli]